MKTFNTGKFLHFVLLPEVLAKRETFGPNAGAMIPAIGSISFRGYTDREGVFGNRGAEVQYVVSVDQQNRPKGKYFTMSQSHNALIVNVDDKDTTGKELSKFIANHPSCEGSKNGTYFRDGNGDQVQLNVKFRLLNSEADAQTALDAQVRRSKAVISASEIDLATLKEVAILGIGLSDVTENILRHKVVEWAGRRPQDYFTILESGDRELRSQVRKAVASNTFQVKGELIYWGSTLIGANENDAISKLMNDPDLLNALKDKEIIDIKKSEPVKSTKKK